MKALLWKIYDFILEVIDKHGNPRPIPREEMEAKRRELEEAAKRERVS